MSEKNILEEDYLNELLNSIMEEDENQEKEQTTDLVLEDEESAAGSLALEDEESMIEGLALEDELPLGEDAFAEEKAVREELTLSEETIFDREEILNEEESAESSDKKKKKSSKKGLFSIFKNNKAEESIDPEESEPEPQSDKEELAWDIEEREPAPEKKKKEKKVKEKKIKEKKPKKIKQPDEEFNGKVKLSFKGFLLSVTFIAVILLAVIMGGSLFSYKQNMDSAKEHFLKAEYKDAYALVSGLTIKGADEDFYQQARLVMYVAKQYESYTNFKLIGEEAKALDSLVKGVENYDAYIEEADEQGVELDLQNVLGQITVKLQEEYNLSEKDARDLGKINDRKEYSRQIYKIVNSIS